MVVPPAFTDAAAEPPAAGLALAPVEPGGLTAAGAAGLEAALAPDGAAGGAPAAPLLQAASRATPARVRISFRMLVIAGPLYGTYLAL